MEGCYIPFDWENDFDETYRKEIRCIRLVMSENYIRRHFDDIRKYACVIEKRPDDSDCTQESVLADNLHELEMCRKFGTEFVYIDDVYEIG